MFRRYFSRLSPTLALVPYPPVPEERWNPKMFIRGIIRTSAFQGMSVESDTRYLILCIDLSRGHDSEGRLEHEPQHNQNSMSLRRCLPATARDLVINVTSRSHYQPMHTEFAREHQQVSVPLIESCFRRPVARGRVCWVTAGDLNRFNGQGDPTERSDAFKVSKF